MAGITPLASSWEAMDSTTQKAIFWGLTGPTTQTELFSGQMAAITQRDVFSAATATITSLDRSWEATGNIILKGLSLVRMAATTRKAPSWAPTGGTKNLKGSRNAKNKTKEMSLASPTHKQAIHRNK
jgi:hypothetical protein